MGLTAGYVALRFVIFGSQAATYSESAVLLGFWHYGSWAALPRGLGLLAVVDSVVKNMVAPFMVIFDHEGGFESVGRLLRLSPAWIPTLIVFVMLSRRSLTRTQQGALAIIALNGLVHFALFRHRVLYLAQLGVSLYFAGAALPTGNRVRSLLITSLVCLSLVANAYWINHELRTEGPIRQQMLAPRALGAFDPNADAAVVEQVIRQYAR